MKQSFSFVLLAVLLFTAACSHEPTLNDEMADLKLDGPETAAAAPMEESVPSESLAEPDLSPLSESSVRQSRPSRKSARKAKKKHGKKKVASRKHRAHRRHGELARRNRGE